MSAAAPNLRKGWCPSLFEPMESGDGLIVRLKPRAATIDAAAARAIADAAQRYGNGIVELTNRANLQLRGARPETVAPIAAMATRQRLAHVEPAVERIRSVMASPLGPDDAEAAFDSHALAADLEHMLEREPALAALPAKFGFLVDGGGVLPLDGVGADIALRPAPGGVRIELADGDAAAECAAVDAVSAARQLALAFLSLGQRTRGHVRRMRDLVRLAGVEAVFAEAGLERTDSRPPAHTAAPQPIGTVDLAGARAALGFGLPFGQIDASGLAALADLAELAGDGTLRVTPWRALLMVGVPADGAARLADRVRRLGLITDSADPRRAISACPGRPACGNATVATRADGARLAAYLGAGALTAASVHVSGCTKGCAHPGPATLTLVGAEGRYDLVIEGRAGDMPVATGLGLDAAVTTFNQMRSRNLR